MRYQVKTAGFNVLAGLAGLAVSTLALVGADQASAGGSPRREAAFAQVAGADHPSVVRVSEREGFPQQKRIRMGRNKSMLVELPRDLRDVVVSNPEYVDAVVQSSNRVYLIGKRVGQTNAFFFDSNGEQILVLELEVEQDAGALDALLRRLLPGSNIKTEMLNDTVILTGTVRNPSDSTRASDIAARFAVNPDPMPDNRARQKVINMLQVEAEEQVMLKVTVAEVERSVLKQFGINLGTELNIGNFATSILTNNGMPLTGTALGAAQQVVRHNDRAFGKGCDAYSNGPGSNTYSTSGLTNMWSSGNNCITNAIKALERNGLIRTLAEPNLTAISGESAKFLAGGEFPIPVSNSSGQMGISFKEFGVAVAFTPVVLSEGRINLKIETEVSEITDLGALQLSGVQIPALKKRQAKSTVELPSGGTLAMAGLISDDTRKNIDGMPGIKDVPILGTLFRSQDFIKKETELVVLVTPYTARPNAMSAYARPTDGLAPASDLKTNLLGHLNRVYGKNAPPTVGGMKDGDVGFIVD